MKKKVGPIKSLHLAKSVLIAQNAHQYTEYALIWKKHCLTSNTQLHATLGQLALWNVFSASSDVVPKLPMTTQTANCLIDILLQLQLLDQTMKLSLLLLFRTGLTQKFSYLLFLFRNIKTSTSSLNIKFFTVHFLGLIFPRNWMLLVSYMTKSGISCCFSERTQCVMDLRCVL